MAIKIRKSKARKKMFNLGTVVKFEVIRVLKKPTFWASAFALPIFMGLVFGIGYFSQKNETTLKEKIKNSEFSFEIQDKSGILNPKFIEIAGGKVSKSESSSIEKVKKGKIDAFYKIPESLKDSKIEIHAKNEGLNGNAKYSSVISELLKNASIETVDQNKQVALSGGVKSSATFYKDGVAYEPLSDMVIPGFFLVIFYIIANFTSGRMLNSTTEEKENRVTEMILTSISSKTLIVGKILALSVIGLIQILTIGVSILAIYFGISAISGTSADLSFLGKIFENINWNFSTIAISAGVFVAGLMAMTGMTVAIGAAMPTAQEANQWFTVVILSLMAPFFVLTMFMDPKPNEVVQFLSYFPMTSPISLLLRNTVGTLSVGEALIGISLLVIFAIIATVIGIKLFQHGTISYGKKLNVFGFLKSKK